MHTSSVNYVYETLASMSFLFSQFKCSCHIVRVSVEVGFKVVCSLLLISHRPGSRTVNCIIMLEFPPPLS